MLEGEGVTTRWGHGCWKFLFCPAAHPQWLLGPHGFLMYEYWWLFAQGLTRPEHETNTFIQSLQFLLHVLAKPWAKVKDVDWRLSFYGDTLLMSILLLSACTVWKWALLLTFQRIILSASSGLKWGVLGLAGLYRDRQGGSTVLWNVSNTASFHTMAAPKIRININNREEYFSVNAFFHINSLSELLN
jgi:hypothetical protein